MLQSSQADRFHEGCRRCGTCCRNGAPALHSQDLALLAENHIAPTQLYTLRKGEPVYDNVRKLRQRLETEIVKIKDRDEIGGCSFFDETEKACSIYARRPLECRILRCWDTREIERVYSRQRLTRRDLLGDAVEWLELIQDHETRCAYSAIADLVKQVSGRPSGTALSDLTSIIGYDYHLRQVLLEKWPESSEMQDFLFGRPLWKTLKYFGLDCQRNDDAFIIRAPAARSTALE